MFPVRNTSRLVNEKIRILCVTMNKNIPVHTINNYQHVSCHWCVNASFLEKSKILRPLANNVVLLTAYDIFTQMEIKNNDHSKNCIRIMLPLAHRATIRKIVTALCYFWPDVATIQKTASSLCYFWPHVTAIQKTVSVFCYFRPHVAIIGKIVSALCYFRPYVATISETVCLFAL